MKKAGDLTAAVARDLSSAFEARGVEVIFDHGDPAIDGLARVGQIASWFGQDYHARSRLALLDIAFIKQGADDLLMLAEVEETASDPKLILGDVFGTLMGDHLVFQGKRRLNVAKTTALVILVKCDASGTDERLAYLESQVNELKHRAKSGNAKIGRVVIRCYSNEVQLREYLESFLVEQLS